ncbi:MAG: SprT-like domain-containing protein [Halovenus sp.]
MRARRERGRSRDDTPEAVVLTRGQLEYDGWTAMAATIRHELVHAHLIGAYGDASHGERFRRLADRLGAPRHCDGSPTPRRTGVATAGAGFGSSDTSDSYGRL